VAQAAAYRPRAAGAWSSRCRCHRRSARRARRFRFRCRCRCSWPPRRRGCRAQRQRRPRRSCREDWHACGRGLPGRREAACCSSCTSALRPQARPATQTKRTPRCSHWRRCCCWSPRPHARGRTACTRWKQPGLWVGGGRSPGGGGWLVGGVRGMPWTRQAQLSCNITARRRVVNQPTQAPMRGGWTWLCGERRPRARGRWQSAACKRTFREAGAQPGSHPNESKHLERHGAALGGIAGGDCRDRASGERQGRRVSGVRPHGLKHLLKDNTRRGVDIAWRGAAAAGTRVAPPSVRRRRSLGRARRMVACARLVASLGRLGPTCAIGALWRAARKGRDRHLVRRAAHVRS
jgi:hypothetical protein